MSSTTAVLEATDVWAGYGGPPVLAGIDLTLRPGDAIGLLGRSGVGKSTLVEVLGGGMQPYQGHVTLDGVPVGKTPRRRRKEVRARLRTVHQNGLAGIDGQRTVEETILDAFKEARKAGRTTSNDVEQALGVVGMPIRFVTRRVGTLSGGERQRVAIARALATRPDLLLLDEPLTAVDQSMREEVATDLRDSLARDGQVRLYLDLVPGLSHEKLLEKLARPRQGRSFGEHLRRQAGVDGVKAALLFEVLGREAGQQPPEEIARTLKHLPLDLLRPRPMAETISTAGGVRLEALDQRLMLRQLPGTFCAGEMLDWEAPTGGYLLTACFASGLRAGRGVLDWLQHRG